MNSTYYLIGLLLGFVVVYYGVFRIFRMRHVLNLSAFHMARLLALAKKSLESLDVPIGALVIYKDEVIGEGYNTVLRAAEAGGHAEINAISDAIKRLGMEQFSLCDRDYLFLVTTFEPCLMCAGAFLNYNIRRVYFLKEKDFLYLSKEKLKFIRYYFQRGKMKHSGQQDALFEQHPRYPLRKVNAGSGK